MATPEIGSPSGNGPLSRSEHSNMLTLDDIPLLSGVDVAFAAGGEFEAAFDHLKDMARKDGITRNWATDPACKLASTFFYQGGKIPPAKPSVDAHLSLRGRRMLRATLGSMYPQHADKIAVCGLLLRELFAIEGST